MAEGANNDDRRSRFDSASAEKKRTTTAMAVEGVGEASKTEIDEFSRVSLIALEIGTGLRRGPSTLGVDGGRCLGDGCEQPTTKLHPTQRTVLLKYLLDLWRNVIELRVAHAVLAVSGTLNDASTKCKAYRGWDRRTF